MSILLLFVVGDKIQDVGDKAVFSYAETENAVTKINAYFGETGVVTEAVIMVKKLDGATAIYGSVTELRAALDSGFF